MEFFQCPGLWALAEWDRIVLGKQVPVTPLQDSRAIVLLMQHFLWLHKMSDGPDFNTLILPQGDYVLMHSLSISLFSADQFLK